MDAPPLTLLVGNLASSRTRREQRAGRSYLVAPATLLVSGVLEGSEGPIYYPPEEVERNPAIWNGLPIVVYHPKTAGLPVSARDPDILEKSGIGYVYRSTAKDGKAQAEMWFDEEHTRRVDLRILNALEAGKSIELSTGLFVTKEPVAPGTLYNGKEYKLIARNYKGDHIAVLPDQIGACSVLDGCGVLVNDATKDKPTIWRRLGEVLGILTVDMPVVNNSDTKPADTKPVDTKPDKDTTVNKTQLVDWLVANCDCWKHQGDRDILNGMSEDKLKALKDGADRARQAEDVAEAARKGFTDPGGTQYVFNTATSRWDPKPPAPAPAPTTPPSARLTAEETEDLEFARQEKNRQKEALISRLVANVANDTDRQAKAQRLRTKSLAEIRELVDLLPPVPDSDQAGHSPSGWGVSTPLYTGAAGPVGNAGRSQADLDDYVPIPVTNWDEEAKLLRESR